MSAHSVPAYAKTGVPPAERVRPPRPVVYRVHRHVTGRLVRLSPVRIGEAKALLLRPLTVEPPFREKGVGQALLARALKRRAQTVTGGDPGR